VTASDHHCTEKEKVTAMNTIRTLRIAVIAVIAALGVAALSAAAAVSAIHPQPVPVECNVAATATVGAEAIPRMVITAKRLTPMEKLADLVSEKMEMLMS
jgi:hypothetical protein